MPGVRVCGFLLLLWCICCVLHVAAQSTDPADVSALRSVKKKLIDPMKHLESWNKGDPYASNWAGVLCSNSDGADGYLRIKELNLLNMNLSGTIASEVGKLSHLEILDFMWNQITGSIPMEIGNLSSLRLLVLNGNKLSGSFPEELGLLSNLNRLQVDENFISGPIPVSFANMCNVKHLHLNNNSISGQLPPELSKLPKLVHLLVDNNNLSGYLPSEYSALETLEILQVDNNPSMVAKIPDSYGNLSRLVKLSLRNCSLSGSIPDLSQITNLTFIDLGWNQLTGPIPSNKLSDNITSVFLSYNHLNGLIPESLSDLPSLQTLSLENNSLSGPIPASLWNKSRNASAILIIDLRNNRLSNISGDLNLSENVTLRLRGNPVCNTNIQGIHRLCDSDSGGNFTSDGSSNPTSSCRAEACPLDQYFEYLPTVPGACFCAAPVRVGYRLKSPSFTVFPPFKYAFETYITHSLNIDFYQLFIDSFAWEEGPRLRMYLKLFPPTGVNHTFNTSELKRIKHIYMSWYCPDSDFFGPYELLNFTLLGPYASDNLGTGNGHISNGALAGILVGVILGAVAVSAVITLLIVGRNKRYQRILSKTQLSSWISIKIDGVKEFTFKEMAQATDNFKSSSQVGQGGYGKVYKGILSDKSVVAIKRAEEGSLQGKREFLTEIQLLSRVHHRNLVSLVGYCGEAGEQENLGGP